MALFTKDIVCPYCLRHVKMNNLVQICSLNPNHKKTKRGIFSSSINCQEPGCNGRYINLACPQCTEQLPANIAQYDGYSRLAIAAPSRGGKTVMINTMLHEVSRNSTLLGLNMGSMDSKTTAYYNRISERLYGSRHEAPDPTEAGVTVPMQWYIQNVRKSRANSVPTYSLTIFDGAGESLQNPSDLETRYIAEAKMLMLLLDPLQLRGIRDQLSPTEIDQAGGDPRRMVNEQDTRLFIDGIVNYIRICNKKTIGQKLDIPVAVVMCKMDIMRRFFPEDAVVFQESGHVRSGKFIESESQQVHAEIDSWIASCCDPLNMALSAVLKKWRYFGVSSYGIAPKSKNQLSAAPKPLRVLDPLMWNLDMAGIL